MNERIRELGRQVGFYMENMHPGGFHNEDLLVLEKFVESIIRECIAQGREIQSQTVNGSNDYLTGREMGIEVFINQIERNFGLSKSSGLERSTYYGNDV